MSIPANDGNYDERLRPTVRTLQIVVAALPAGVLVFAASAVCVRLLGAARPAAQELEALNWLAIAAAPLALVVSSVLPGVLARNARRQIAAGAAAMRRGTDTSAAAASDAAAPGSETDDAARLFTAYQAGAIITAATLEGAGLVGVVAYLLNGYLIGLGLAVLLALAILLTFPSISRAGQWIDDQQRLMNEEQLLAG